MTLRWTGKESAEIVGRTRALCYAPGSGEIALYQQRLANDARVTADDLLLAERDGQAVGTATSYSMKMWVRGQAFPCQGVAYVGTIKTHRRSSGIASQVMRETLRKAREREQVLSALLPFRASYYEHFGYGLVERRANWTIPLSILPTGPTDSFKFINGADDARQACWQRMVEAGQCNLERPPGFWAHWTAQEADGFVVADQAPGQPMRSWFDWEQQKQNGKDVLLVEHMAYDSIDSLRRGLNFFATLKDQYFAVTLSLPVDLQLNRLLKQSHVARRESNDDRAEVKMFSRLQVRVLDHARLIAGMRLPETARGSAVVAIAESEGTISTLRIEMSGGQGSASPTAAPPDLECTDRDWAAIVLGDLPATRAADLGLLKVHRPAAVTTLDAFAVGPAPFCSEYF
jgi:predicted acetyltransferase